MLGLIYHVVEGIAGILIVLGVAVVVLVFVKEWFFD